MTGKKAQGILIWLAIGAIAVASGVIAHQASRDRGLTTESIWLMEASGQRVEYYGIWLGLESDEARSARPPQWNEENPELINRTFAPHAAIPPLVPALAATTQAALQNNEPMSLTLGRINAILFALFVFTMGGMCLLAGGPLGAILGAVGAATLPRLFGLGSSVGLGMAAVLVLTVTLYALQRSSQSRWATLLSVLGIAASIHVGVLGLFVWAPWLLTALSREPSSRRGEGFTFLPRLGRRLIVVLAVVLAMVLTQGYLGGYLWTMVELVLIAVGLFLVGRLLYYVFFHGKHDDGFAATSELPLRTVLAVPVGLALGFWAYPFLWVETKDHVLLWLTHFLRAPAEPFSFGGEIWGRERIPIHAAPYILAVTTPPALVLLALAGIRGGDFYRRLMEVRLFTFLKYLPPAPSRGGHELRARYKRSAEERAGRVELLRLAKLMLVITLLLPLVFRSPYLGGLDLIAIALPWLVVLTAAGLERLLPLVLHAIPWEDLLPGEGARVGARVMAGTVFTMLLIFPSVLDVMRYHPMPESYYSWVVGGPEGARRQGLPRYPKGPLPLTIFDAVAAEVGERPTRAAFMIRGPSYERATHIAMSEKRIPENIALSGPIFDADVAILPHDDLHPDYERAATDFFRTLHTESGFEVLIFERDSVPIFTVAIRKD